MQKYAALLWRMSAHVQIYLQGAGQAASGKQQLKHMFKQQWLLKEQAADCICLELMLQLIQELCVCVCVCV